jgi:hypothetical protein
MRMTLQFVLFLTSWEAHAFFPRQLFFTSGSRGSTPREIIFLICCAFIPGIAHAKSLTDQLMMRLPAMNLRDGGPIEVERHQHDRHKRLEHDRGGWCCRFTLVARNRLLMLL